jgi:hypothetical protein
MIKPRGTVNAQQLCRLVENLYGKHYLYLRGTYRPDCYMHTKGGVVTWIFGHLILCKW